ncbi:MAG: DUF2306 domain-containing protein [Bacteroidota bacterium]
MKTLIKNTARDIGLYLVLCACTFLMLRIITEHFTLKPDTGFLAVKQQYIHIKVWRTAFYIHVFSSILTLMAGFTQFSSFILREQKVLHRLIGKIYIIAVLFINFPSGMILAFYANGHLPSKIAFVILDSLWFWFTIKAFLEIRRGNVVSHKRFMIRSYALTFSAITLRTWKMILSNSFVIDPVTLYMIDAWMGFVPNLLLAEWLIRRKQKQKGRISVQNL